MKTLIMANRSIAERA